MRGSTIPLGSRDQTFAPHPIIFLFRGGLSNQLYYCALPENLKPRNAEPSEVLLRLFGKHLQQPTSQSDESSEYFIAALVLENVIFTLLSERNLGPKLLGVFAGGRLEEFIKVKIYCNRKIVIISI